MKIKKSAQKTDKQMYLSFPKEERVSKMGPTTLREYVTNCLN